MLSQDPLTMCLPSGEYATDSTSFECPVSVHSCSWTNPRTSASAHAAENDTPGQNTVRTCLPVAAFQTFTVLSYDPLTMCLPSGEYANERTKPECPLSVRSCSWTKRGGHHQCTQQQTIGQ